MLSFQHLLITRFNIRIDRDIDHPLSEAWLRQRMQLFERYCLPSVMAQTCRQFTWLILMDAASTPPDIRQQMEAYRQLCAIMQVLYLPPLKDISAFYHQLACRYAEAHPYILTTRLDNDDVIADTYIEQVQNFARQISQIPSVISFPHGAQLFVCDKVALGLHWSANHFVSLLETADDQTHTIFDFNHVQVSDVAPVVEQDTALPAWGELVHQNNVANDYTPHTHPRVESWNQLPFAGDWEEYLHTGKNIYYLLVYHLRYRLRSVRNLLRRFF
ncbi:MAG: putative rhamnosyl transferase [Paludibacteraceae bacterium]|nr:putative rhamnosyl transferase [Paludibacteraceae bacterium]